MCHRNPELQRAYDAEQARQSQLMAQLTESFQGEAEKIIQQAQALFLQNVYRTSVKIKIHPPNIFDLENREAFFKALHMVASKNDFVVRKSILGRKIRIYIRGCEPRQSGYFETFV